MIAKAERAARRLIPGAGYIRMSSAKQEHSPERQRTLIETRAQQEGIKIVVWYTDEAKTGTESKKRLDFQRLLTDAKRGLFKAVIYSEQSRFSREDPFDVVAHWKLFRDANVMLVSCQKGTVDWNSLGGIITALVEAHGARAESVTLAGRVATGKREGLNRGQRQGAFIYGYDRELLDNTGAVVKLVVGPIKYPKAPGWRSRLVPAKDKQSIKAVRYAFERAAKGAPWGKIAREMNAEGFRTLFGKRFSSSAVRRIVENRTYCGQISIGLNGKRRRGKFASVLDHGEAIIFPDAHQAIITAELFELAQAAIRRKRSTRTTKSPCPGKYLLSGVLFCGTAGARLQGLAPDGMPPHYGPNTQFYDTRAEGHRGYTYRQDIIEKGVITKIVETFFNPEQLRQITRTLNRRVSKDAKIETELATIRAKLERGTENLALADAADVPALTRLLAGWRDEEAVLLARLSTRAGGPTPESVKAIARLHGRFKLLDRTERDILAGAIRQTVKRITLWTDIRRKGRNIVRLWTGEIEFCPSLEVAPVELKDEDIPTPAVWREVVKLADTRDSLYCADVRKALKYTNNGSASCRLIEATLAGKLRDNGHCKGWSRLKST